MARPKPCAPGVLHRRQLRDPAAQVLENLPRRVRAAIVDDDDLVRNALQPQLEVQVLDRRRDAALLVPRRDDDGQLRRAGAARDRATLALSTCRSVCVRARNVEPVGMRRRVVEDLLQDVVESSGTALQSPDVAGAAMHPEPSREGRTGRSSRTRSTAWSPRRSRHQSLSCASDRADRTPAADVDDARQRRASLARDLPFDQRHEVGRMQAVAHLVTRGRRSRCSATGGRAASC